MQRAQRTWPHKTELSILLHSDDNNDHTHHNKRDNSVVKYLSKKMQSMPEPWPQQK
jgi:hypothetical protein